ncbi:MAG TPA: hypothetical protein VGH20_09660 [Myxococcales bacterium]|jgi:hypothetical protein
MKIVVLGVLVCAACGGAVNGPSDVSLEWSFGGQDCQLARVSTIDVLLDGADLGAFPCLDSRGLAQSLDLGLLRGGPHDVVLTGLDAASSIIYQSEATLPVANDRAAQDFTVDADPQFGHVAFSWDFGLSAANPQASCAEAGISSVQLAIDGVLASSGGSVDLPCSTAAGTDGITLDVAPGTHNVTFTARDASGALYTGANPVTVFARQDTVDADDLGAVFPVAFLGATFRFENAAFDCEQAGIETLAVVLDADQGSSLQVPGQVSCELGGGAIANSLVVPVFTPGFHTVELLGYRNGVVAWQSPALVSATLTPGTETDLVLDAEPVP